MEVLARVDCLERLLAREVLEVVRILIFQLFMREIVEHLILFFRLPIQAVQQFGVLRVGVQAVALHPTVQQFILGVMVELVPQIA